MKLHHIGIATDNIEETVDFFNRMNIVRKQTKKIYDELQDAWLCMLYLEGLGNIELIEGNAVKGYLKRHINLYHTCYEVENIQKEMEKWINNGAVLVSDEKPAKLFNNRKVAFLITPMGLMELLESRES